MRAPIFLAGLVQWRWTPSVVLVAGSLAFVGFAVLIVPDDLGSIASGADRLSRAAQKGVAKKVEAPADESLEPSADDVTSPHRPAGISQQGLHAGPPARNIVQSIFHPTPKPELPVEPVDPNPPPPPEPTPPPAPTQTTYTLDNPPAPPTVPNAPPAAEPEAP